MLILECSEGRLMDERIPITAAAPWIESSVDGGGPSSHADVAEEIWQALRRKAAGARDVPSLGLVVQGGGMRGVYSMAVLAAFEEMGWTHCFDHVAGGVRRSHERRSFHHR